MPGMAPLNLSTGPSSISVKVHPSVLLNICDVYIRRNSKQNRVVGTLLGYFSEGSLEIKNCYAVPHQHTPDSVISILIPSSSLFDLLSELLTVNDIYVWQSCRLNTCLLQIDFDIPQHHTMKDLHHRVNPREVVVGWCAFLSAASEDATHIHALNTACFCSALRNFLRLCRFMTGTGDQLGGRDVLVQEFYESECPHPVRVSSSPHKSGQQRRSARRGIDVCVIRCRLY